MKKISFLTIILAVFIFSANSQDLKFNEREFDFGEIKEMGGKVSHKFVFTNNSKKSIQILTVKPSCGCTTPDWSKKEIKPGKEGFIVAEYNPRGRPGVFRKSLSVVTSDNKRSVIFIAGKKRKGVGRNGHETNGMER